MARVRWRLRDLVGNPWGKPRFLWCSVWSCFQAVRRVLLPLLVRAILAVSAMLFVFTLDDFVIANNLSRDVATGTISVKIWAARGTPTPVVNALGSLMLFATTIVIALTYFLFRRLTRGEQHTGETEIPLA